MKKLTLLTLALISFQVIGQVSDQIVISEIKPVVKEVSELTQNFKIDGTDNINLGAPDYKFASEYFLKIISQKKIKFEFFLNSLNAQLKPDYQIIEALRKENQTTAVASTLNQAKSRYKKAILDNQGWYRNELADFIYGDFYLTASYCLTVLCIEKIKEDILSWIKVAKKINKDLDFDVAKLNPLTKRKIRESVESVVKDVNSKGTALPVTLLLDSVECKNLMDPSLSLDKVSEFGVEAVSIVGYLKLKEDKEKLKRKNAEFLSTPPKEILNRIIHEQAVGACKVVTNFTGNAFYITDPAGVYLRETSREYPPQMRFDYSETKRAISVTDPYYERLVKIIKDSGRCNFTN